MIGVQQT